MHMRSGDVLEALDDGGLEYWKMAPCEFWVQAFRRDSYKHALIVTEPDLQHPCIDVVNSTFPGQVVVQSGGVLEDFCTMMHSQNMAVGISTLATTLLELSLVVRKVFAPDWFAEPVFEKSGLFEHCTAASFPGYPQKFDNVSHKFNFLRSYPGELVVWEGRPCGPEHYSLEGFR